MPRAPVLRITRNLTLIWLGLSALSQLVYADDAVPAFIRSHINGGLIVQVGGNQQSAVPQLAPTGRYLVQMLVGNPAQVVAAREALQKSGWYGLATADQLGADGKLPYAENLANAVVLADATARLPMDEIARVLCPGGWVIGPARSLSAGSLPGAGFEAVGPLAPGSARLVGRKSWPAEMDCWSQPRHAADGNPVSQDSLVGPPRRVRWIAGPPQEISNMVSAEGRIFFGGVIARDAFNGLPLWQQQLGPSPARGGFLYKAASNAPRPIAVGKELLLVRDGKLVALGGATGDLVREYPAAGTPLETVVDNGLILAIDKTSIRAIDYTTGQLRWEYEAAEPRCVVAGEGGVYCIQGEPRRGDPVSLVRVDETSGHRLWQQKDLDILPKIRQCVYRKGRLVCEISTLSDAKEGNLIQVLSAADGKPLWDYTFVPGSQHWKQARAMFVGEILWLLTNKGCVALDPATGATEKSFPGGAGHCFPPVATPHFVLHGEMHLTNLDTGELDANPITKGNCSRDIGFMPANGLIYTTPKHCICWPMLRDYTALAPAKAGSEKPLPVEALPVICQRGPAAAPRAVPNATADPWPCYRHDAWRSASTPGTIPTDLKVRWTAKLGGWPKGTIAGDWQTDSYIRGPVTPPVIAGGLVYVARPDAQQVVALDAATGAVRWQSTVNGRVDTAPTIHRGLCLFGTKSGWVYALRADDGQLVWRMQAAPGDEQIVAYGQLESPWPVAGSVLVVDGVLYFAAGRQPLADGGILVFAVQPDSGKRLWVQRIDQVPQQLDRVPRPFYNSSGLEFDNYDLLHREGDAVAMSRWLFQRNTGHLTCDAHNGFTRVDTEANGGGVWMPRGCWSYAPRNETEYCKERPFLRPLAACRGNRLYSFAQDRKTVFRRDFDLSGGEKFDTSWFAGWKTYADARKGGDLWRSQRLAHGAKWTVTPLPQGKEAIAGSALLLAGNALVIAGGQGDLAILSPEDGQPIGRVQLPAVVWDGLAAADGKLLAVTQEGDVVCLAAK
jgi:outer membrane protein assembly factor BamB